MKKLGEGITILPAVKMTGKCRVHKCNRKAKALIIHEGPGGKVHHFRECLIHAKDWEDVEDVVIIFEGEGEQT